MTIRYQTHCVPLKNNHIVFFSNCSRSTIILKPPTSINLGPLSKFHVLILIYPFRCHPLSSHRPVYANHHAQSNKIVFKNTANLPTLGPRSKTLPGPKSPVPAPSWPQQLMLWLSVSPEVVGSNRKHWYALVFCSIMRRWFSYNSSLLTGDEHSRAPSAYPSVKDKKDAHCFYQKPHRNGTIGVVFYTRTARIRTQTLQQVNGCVKTQRDHSMATYLCH